MQKLFITLGAVLLLVGILWPFIGKIPLGRLPGDIIINRPGLKFFFPVTTMVIISLILSVIAWFLRK